MSWVLLWLLVGGTSGWLKSYLERRYGPIRPSDEQKKDRRRSLLVGLALGPLYTLACPEFIIDVIKDRKALTGPSAKDSLQSCLKLRQEIRRQIRETDRAMDKRQALLGGVQYLLERDFSQTAAQRTGLQPTSDEMPSPAELSQASQQLQALRQRREALQEGLALTEERIADLRCEYEGQIEMAEVPRELLRPNPALVMSSSQKREAAERALIAHELSSTEAGQQANAKLANQAAALPEPAPEPTQPAPTMDELIEQANREIDQRMLERLGTVSDEVRRRLWGKVDWCLNSVADGHGATHCWTRAVYLSEAYLEAATDKAFLNRRGQIACWLATEVGDRRLGVAVSQAETAQEAQELIRWRLRQTIDEAGPEDKADHEDEAGPEADSDDSPRNP